MNLARFAAIAVVAASLAPFALAQTTITDATGRSIAVPSKIGKVYAAGPPASVFVLALAPDKLAGWTRALRPDEVPFLPPELARLPELGRLTGRGNTANVEVLMAAKPDLIVDIGSTSPTYVSLAERVQQATGIPYLLFDEPTANLDYGNKLRVLRELERLRGEGRTILFSTHDPDHALAHADRALLIADGKMQVLAPVVEALTDDTLSALYGVPVQVTEVAGVRRVFPVTR